MQSSGVGKLMKFLKEIELLKDIKDNHEKNEAKENSLYVSYKRSSILQSVGDFDARETN